MPNLDPAVIQDVRRIIKDNDWSKRLHCRQIGTLLDLCQMHVSPESAEEVKTAQVDEVLAILLRISDGHTF